MATNKITRTVEGKGEQSFYLVHTTNTVEPDKGETLISANLRETKEKKVTDEQRYRSIAIAEFSLPTVEDKFRKVLVSKFYELAKERLEDLMAESNRMLREVNCSLFTVESLLEYYAIVAVSQRLTGDAVAAWFDNSSTGKYIVQRCGTDTAKLKKFRDFYIKTASPNHGINPKTCEALLATMQVEDAASGIGETLAGKWQATIKKSQDSEVDSL